MGKELYGQGAIQPQGDRGYREMVIINALFHHREVLGRARGNVEGSRPSGVDPVRGVWILGSMRYVVTWRDRIMKIVPWEMKGFVHMSLFSSRTYV